MSIEHPELDIRVHVVCKLCLEEHGDTPLGEYVRIAVGLTDYGMQIYCLRHRVSIQRVKARVEFSDNQAIPGKN